MQNLLVKYCAATVSELNWKRLVAGSNSPKQNNERDQCYRKNSLFNPSSHCLSHSGYLQSDRSALSAGDSAVIPRYVGELHGRHGEGHGLPRDFEQRQPCRREEIERCNGTEKLQVPIDHRHSPDRTEIDAADIYPDKASCPSEQSIFEPSHIARSYSRQTSRHGSPKSAASQTPRARRGSKVKTTKPASEGIIKADSEQLKWLLNDGPRPPVSPQVDKNMASSICREQVKGNSINRSITTLRQSKRVCA